MHEVYYRYRRVKGDTTELQASVEDALVQACRDLHWGVAEPQAVYYHGDVLFDHAALLAVYRAAECDDASFSFGVIRRQAGAAVVVAQALQEILD